MDLKTKREIVAVLRQQGRSDLIPAIAAPVDTMKKSVAGLLKQAKTLARSKFPLESASGVKIVGLLRQIEKHLDVASK
jgi:hypothetical protein